MSYKKTNGAGKFFAVLGVILLILVVIASVLAILYTTIPAVHDFILNLFKVKEEVKALTINQITR